MLIVSTFCQFVNVNYLLKCFWEGREVWKWILCGYYYLLQFLGGSEGMEVDIMWSGYYYLLESVLGASGCGYYYLLECFWGSLDVWMWIFLFATMFLGGVWMSGYGYYVDIIIC